MSGINKSNNSVLLFEETMNIMGSSKTYLRIYYKDGTSEFWNDATNDWTWSHGSEWEPFSPDRNAYTKETFITEID
jgi:hypothetical protein